MTKADIDKNSLDLIRAVMSGQKWDKDTLDRIAYHVRMTGRIIKEVDHELET